MAALVAVPAEADPVTASIASVGQAKDLLDVLQRRLNECTLLAEAQPQAFRLLAQSGTTSADDPDHPDHPDQLENTSNPGDTPPVPVIEETPAKGDGPSEEEDRAAAAAAAAADAPPGCAALVIDDTFRTETAHKTERLLALANTFDDELGRLHKLLRRADAQQQAAAADGPADAPAEDEPPHEQLEALLTALKTHMSLEEKEEVQCLQNAVNDELDSIKEDFTQLFSAAKDLSQCLSSSARTLISGVEHEESRLQQELQVQATECSTIGEARAKIKVLQQESDYVASEISEREVDIAEVQTWLKEAAGGDTRK
eukprot:GHVT01096708.1.p1 GENE.GHVT01096708.1~~GHVT01096708.1.p1  ORF type:complete len:314 (+),score=85.51 GHVT01096708.1:441-1382(+)